MSKFTGKDGALDMHKLFDAIYELKKRRDMEPPVDFFPIPLQWMMLADVGALRALRSAIEAEVEEPWASELYSHVVAGVPFRRMLRQDQVANEFATRHAVCTDEARESKVTAAARLTSKDPWCSGGIVRVTPRALMEELR